MTEDDTNGPWQEHSIEVPRTARYWLLGPESSAGSSKPKVVPASTGLELWYVLHGYGQLAVEFAREFEPHVGSRRAIVAPEGLSRFYRKGGFGEIGASWMTSIAREAEIADYVRYLDRLHVEVNATVDAPSVNVLGFSQGAATALRWATLGSVRFERCVLWSGGVPPDIDVAASAERLKGTTFDLVFGERDAYFDRDKAEASKERLMPHAHNVHLHGFRGGHRLDRDLMAQLFEEEG